MRIRLTDGEVDLEARVVLRGDERLDLTPREVDLLRHLASHSGAVPLANILTEVWGYSASAQTQAVHVAVRRLRPKIEVDPGEPVHLITVAGVGWKLVPAAAKASSASGRDPLVGRDDLVAEVGEAIAASSLVTLVGPGGIGKTRVARALLADARGRFVDLTAARTTADVSGAVLDGNDPVCLGDDLVVLDNVEQVAGVCADLVGEWMRAVPTARFLTTSRVPLRLTAERVVRVDPLTLPDGVQLFESRCRALGVQVSGDPAVPALVEAVDGNPLALELAAARIPVLSPAQLLERGSGVLRARERDRPARHASLDDVVAWSFNLLTRSEQEALEQLMVFVGGFTLEAAEAVVRLPGVEALDAVHGLLDASLLRRLEPGRFAPWVAVSTYLEGRGQPPDDAVGRHLHYYASMGSALRRNAQPSLEIMRKEGGNTRIALTRALGRTRAADPSVDRTVADLCVAVGLSAAASVHREAVPLIEQARRRLPPAHQPTAAYGHAKALSRFDPVAGAQIAVEATRADGETGWRARILVVELLRDAAQFSDAHRAAEDALGVATSPSQRAEALVHRATAAERLGDGDAALAGLAAAASIEGVDEARWTLILATRGLLRAENQDWDGAEADCLAALERYLAAGDVVNAGVMHSNVSTVYNYQGRHREAAASAERAVTCFTEVGWLARTSSPLMVIANIRRMSSRLEEAADLLGRAADVARRTGNRTASATAQCHLAQVRRQQGRYDAADGLLVSGIATLRAVGARHRLVELVTLRGEIALDRGEVAVAVAALTEAEEVAEGLSETANARRTIEWLRDRLTDEA